MLVTDLGDAPSGADDRLSALIAPVPGGEGMIGAIAVFFPKDYTIGPDETEALSVLAAQSSVAISNAQRFERQRIVARSLQDGLLSADMPTMAECDIGAVYEAASGEADVGGDFYDVFELTKDRFALVVGDVSGKGAEAAAQTAIAKYMLRAFAMRDPSPSSVLFHLNNALVRGYGEDRFATAVYGLFDSKAHSATIAVAGHPSPLVYRADGEEIEVVEAEGSLLGVFEDQQYQSKTFDLYPGDVFLVYTDGLTEARGEGDSKELYGRSRVEDSLTRHCTGGSAAEIARRVFQDATASARSTTTPWCWPSRVTR